MKNLNDRPVTFTPPAASEAPAVHLTAQAHQLFQVGLHLTEIRQAYNSTLSSVARASWIIPAEAAAGASVVIPLWVSGPKSMLELDSVFYLPGAALTADDTNYSTLELTTDDGTTGRAKVTRRQLAVATTKTQASAGTGSWLAETPVRLALPAGGKHLFGANSMLTWRSTKTGTGVAVPLGSLLVSWRV